ncbi:MAG: hypothetical protein PVI06_16255 [Desulfobacterales bacterium]|jgi:hypothetical protein
MEGLNDGDILTKVTRYNLIRNERMIYLDVHERIFGNLAGRYLAVPNLINIVAEQQYQGVGDSEAEALKDCLIKIKEKAVEDIFPEK